jgi:hypothetical protein
MDWYLIIPWVIGVAGWLIARWRQWESPFWVGVACFLLIGAPIVVLFDLGILG